MKYLQKSLLPVLLFGLISSASGAVLLQDNFNDNSLDPAKWATYIPSGTGITSTPSVAEANERLELKGRGYLNSAFNIDPDDYSGGISITGTWTFTNTSDFISIVTRSSGVQAGNYGETSSGAEFRSTTNGELLIQSRSGDVSINSAVNSTFTMNLNSLYDFTVIDGNGKLSITLTERGNTANTATATANLGPVRSSYTSNLITFKNREGGSTAYLDDVVISSIPEPSSSLLIVLSAFSLFARRRR